ncbi:cytochrome b [Sphingomonas parva]|uniref:Cytochrome b n=1 Tax=Sphingomonas parva TaxID=2555898 RepID=A0A4Y8ZN45_9SPHN|nr:cytochrome b [Sphingomonas parva]TFI56585.1 cytochrome b [Sphingomonas parva]
MTGQEAARYTRVAIWLHWIIAALVVANLFLGFFHEDFGKAATPWMMFYHKSFGLTVLGLTLARLAWRLGHRPPAFDPALKPWEARLAGVIHALFYVALIAIPLSGWLLSSSSARGTNFFGLFDIAPLPISRSDDVHDLFEELHELLGLAMVGLLALHVAGALKHHLQGHRHLIGRMAPFLYRS